MINPVQNWNTRQALRPTPPSDVRDRDPPARTRFPSPPDAAETIGGPGVGGDDHARDNADAGAQPRVRGPAEDPGGRGRVERGVPNGHRRRRRGPRPRGDGRGRKRCISVVVVVVVVVVVIVVVVDSPVDSPVVVVHLVLSLRDRRVASTWGEKRQVAVRDIICHTPWTDSRSSVTPQREWFQNRTALYVGHLFHRRDLSQRRPSLDRHSFFCGVTKL